MNQDFSKTQEFLQSFLQNIPFVQRKYFIFFPPALLAAEFARYTSEGLIWGAQNFYCEEAGAYTGENSPELYRQMGAQVMLVGHSERRSLFAETNDFLQKKILKALSLGLCPMLCVGESLEERQSGKWPDVLRQQLQILEAVAAFFSENTTTPLSGAPHLTTRLYIAYEPVWAIGTGQVASPKDVLETHALIAEVVKDIMGSLRVPILYGGSVKPDNAHLLSQVAGVDGFLIGGASLQWESFAQIAQAVKL